MPNAESLFTGEHTRTVAEQRISTKSGIGMFAVTMLSCLSCKTQIKSGAVCAKCKPKEMEIFVKKMFVTKSKEEEFNKLWAECQRCMGSVCQEVICSNQDCSIFYRRVKVQKDLKDANDHLARFNTGW